MNKTRNTLNPAIRRQSVLALNLIVADLFDLFARIKQAHWNVRGTSFIGWHKLLDEFAATTITRIDSAAELATALGGIVEGTLRESVKRSSLKKKEEPVSRSGLKDWINELADVHAASGQVVRQAITGLNKVEDFAPAELQTDILRDLDKQLWLLEAHLNQHQPSN